MKESSYQIYRCACADRYCVQNEESRRISFVDSGVERDSTVSIDDCPKRLMLSKWLETDDVSYLMRASEM